jgi:hypothetical protein
MHSATLLQARNGWRGCLPDIYILDQTGAAFIQRMNTKFHGAAAGAVGAGAGAGAVGAGAGAGAVGALGAGALARAGAGAGAGGAMFGAPHQQLHQQPRPRQTDAEDQLDSFVRNDMHDALCTMDSANNPQTFVNATHSFATTCTDNALLPIKWCTRGVLFAFTTSLGLKPSHTCDVISVATEFMVDIARVEAWPYV